ncbi:alpha/beta fold hydrolase [Streptomyces sp. AC563]|uniref:alpha/beta hydrolase n=1 Tax=Streptomyces buecherae TaxID=2763006 RepID=UPI00164D9F18|nr:alpha/beta hydrolase [Streptomyces buecherae]MBC3993570.1 alpha/beta fold hydrolase [Streptomyces buecherae]
MAYPQNENGRNPRGDGGPGARAERGPGGPETQAGPGSEAVTKAGPGPEAASAITSTPRAAAPASPHRPARRPVPRGRVARCAAPALGLVLAASLLGAANPAEAARPTGAPGASGAPGARGGEALDWQRCAIEGADPRQECATVRVPLDYARPNGRQIDIAVSRIRSEQPGDRRGALLLIPGGPGNSGLNGPSSKGQRLPSGVRGAYDLIGFDPRGVGSSTPVTCGLPHEQLATVNLRAWPDADGGLTGPVTRARTIAETCARDGGELARHISTRNEARDIDRIRRALGEDKLSAWGHSYGTYAGSVYARMFPDRTDRWVLDSNDDPNPRRVARQWQANYAVGVEDSFPAFAAWATDPANGPVVADRPEQVRPLFLRLAAELDRDPLPWPGANPDRLTGNHLRQVMLDSLGNPARFAFLAQVINAVRTGGALPAPGTQPSDAFLRNNIAVAVATICNDVSWPRSLPTYERNMARDRARHPLTAGMPASVMPCAFWPYAPREPATRITDHGPANVLLVQNLRDVSTPHSGALRLRSAFGDRARMVSVDATGHGAYMAVDGNACGDRLVTDFLVAGRRPAHDVTCADAANIPSNRRAG